MPKFNLMVQSENGSLFPLTEIRFLCGSVNILNATTQNDEPIAIYSDEELATPTKVFLQIPQEAIEGIYATTLALLSKSPEEVPDNSTLATAMAQAVSDANAKYGPGREAGTDTINLERLAEYERNNEINDAATKLEDLNKVDVLDS